MFTFMIGMAEEKAGRMGRKKVKGEPSKKGQGGTIKRIKH
jgi:hypothetical protein